jgi:DNA processing protein
MDKTIRLRKSENVLLDVFPEEIEFFVRGELPKVRRAAVAIVGTRKPTAYGEQTAYNIAYELARQRITVISGLAIGVDAAAHKGALDGAAFGGTASDGQAPSERQACAPTIAVLAGGVDAVTPSQNTALGERILSEGGAIISEYDDGTPVKAFRLLARNRIVSGLADAVIIVEAAAKSGTLATARHAMKQGRPVFAVPGRLTDKMSAGCHILLEKHPEQVRIFTSVKNVLEEIRQSSSSRTASLAPVATGQVRLALGLPASEMPLGGALPESVKTPRDEAGLCNPSIKVREMIRAGASSTEITEKLGITAGELAMVQTELELFG